MSRATQERTRPEKKRAYGAVTLSGRRFHGVPRASPQPYTCALLPRRGVATAAVWAPPGSLAATSGIIVIFSSCGY